MPAKASIKIASILSPSTLSIKLKMPIEISAKASELFFFFF